MLGAAQADALRPQPAGSFGVLGGVGVGPDGEPADGIGVGQQPVDRLHQVGGFLVGPVEGGLQAALDVCLGR